DSVPPRPVEPWCHYFFFPADDGIRDLTVTGVQTCALPICATSSGAGAVVSRETATGAGRAAGAAGAAVSGVGSSNQSARSKRIRSEERRVGKEGGAGWAERP